jgi:alpha-1,3-rhamnosyl/mannosyltransferase
MVHPYFWNVDAPKIITFNGDEPVSEFGLRKRLHILGSMFSVRYLSSLASIYLLKRRVDEFVVVSSLMRENIACGYGINESKINVIHHGIDTNAFSEVTGEQLRDSLREVGVSRPYILHVSGFRPVKNTQRILEAYDRANLPTDTSLVFAGKKINEYEDVRRMVTRKNINGVCFAGFVDENLQALYSGAEVLCQPSYRETFGFPFLESLACGTPVITSRKIGSLEGYPDSQVQIDPESVSEIRRALEQVVPDKTCQQELVDAGRPILRERTWDKTVEKTLAVYREAIQ